jgi:ribosomal protein S27AE
MKTVIPGYILLAFEDLLMRGTRGDRTLTALIRHFRRTGSWPGEREVERLVAGAAFMCPDCGSISANLQDALNAYCGACHRFPFDRGFGK